MLRYLVYCVCVQVKSCLLELAFSCDAENILTKSRCCRVLTFSCHTAVYARSRCKCQHVSLLIFTRTHTQGAQSVCSPPRRRARHAHKPENTDNTAPVSSYRYNSDTTMCEMPLTVDRGTPRALRVWGEDSSSNDFGDNRQQKNYNHQNQYQHDIIGRADIEAQGCEHTVSVSICCM